MSRAGRRLAGAGITGALTVGLLLGGAALGAPERDRQPSVPSQAAGPANGTLEALQVRLARVPGDYPGWASLAMQYVDRARTTADPSWYGKAEQALERSFQVRPDANSPALTAQASLHAARHQFAEAEASARASLAINDFDATTYGVLTDALTELGRYDEAAQALQRMADLDPGYAALTRISYARELRGDVSGARAAMQQALDAAGTAADAGFALHRLGELALSYGGDVTTADALFTQGLTRDPASLPLQAAHARATAAQGRVDEALLAYDKVVARVPVQQYLLEQAEILDAQDRPEDASAQRDLVRTSLTLLRAAGSQVDLEAALFEADHGLPEQALVAARSTYDARPGNVFAADALAWALHRTGDDAQALAYADQALALGIRPATFLFHRGMIASSLGRSAATQRDLRETLHVNPHFSQTDAAAARATLAAQDAAR